MLSIIIDKIYWLMVMEAGKSTWQGSSYYFISL